VEGFGLTDAGLVAPHAWCAHPDGTVEDPTWDDAGRAYLGIAFTPDYLAEFEARRGTVTVLFGQHLDDMRLLREGLPENAFADSGIRTTAPDTLMPGRARTSRPHAARGTYRSETVSPCRSRPSSVSRSPALGRASVGSSVLE
jgi:hypothetical protein